MGLGHIMQFLVEGKAAIQGFANHVHWRQSRPRDHDCQKQDQQDCLWM